MQSGPVKYRLLLVDGDPKSLRVLDVSLKKAGFDVTTATNGVEALAIVGTQVPDLIISDTDMPEMDGFELCRRIKQRPDGGKIPFIFLSGRKTIEDKIKGLELGVEDYLTKPIYIKEITIRVKMALQRAQRERLESRRDGGRTKFEGALSDINIVDLVQTIELNRKSGIIHIVNPDGRRASVYFRDGQVIDAEVGRLSGAEAVYRLFAWSDGSFEVEFKSIRRKDIIDLSPQALLMEGMRRLDEWTLLLDGMPAVESVFEVDYVLLADRLGDLPDETNRVLRLVDGRRTLMQVIDDAECSDLEALAIVRKLHEDKLLVVAAREAARSAPDRVAARSPGSDTLPGGEDAGDEIPVAPEQVESEITVDQDPPAPEDVALTDVAEEVADPLQVSTDDDPTAVTVAPDARPAAAPEPLAASPPPDVSSAGDVPAEIAADASVPGAVAPPDQPPVDRNTTLEPLSPDDARGAAAVAPPAVAAANIRRDEDRMNKAEMLDELGLPNRGRKVMLGIAVLAVAAAAALVFRTGTSGKQEPSASGALATRPGLDEAAIAAETVSPPALAAGEADARAAKLVRNADSAPPTVASAPSVDSDPRAAVPAIAFPTGDGSTLLSAARSPSRDAAPAGDRAAAPAAARAPAPAAVPGTGPVVARDEPRAAALVSPTKAAPLPANAARTPGAEPRPAPVGSERRLGSRPTALRAPGVAGAASEAIAACRKAYRGGRGRYKDVNAACRAAHQATPGAAEIMVMLAHAELERGQPSDALFWAKKAVQADPDRAEAYVFIGGAEQEAGRRAEAKAAYRKYLELAPNGRYARDLRAIVDSL